MKSLRTEGVEVRRQAQDSWIHVFVDGASKGNPGPAGLGVVFKGEKGDTIASFREYLGSATNNVAEYRAMLLALNKAAELGHRRLKIHTDSELMHRQLSGIYKVRQPHLIALFREVAERLRGLDAFEILHVPRERNREADELANKAIEEYFRSSQGP